MTPRVLVFGWGNPGRLDDGLGPALVRELAARVPAGRVRFESAYQLQVEDAVLVASHDLVIFVDAHRTCADPFEVARVVPRDSRSFTTHAVSPETVLQLAREHFGSRTVAFLLGIRGEAFDEYGEGFTERARRNLDATIDVLRRILDDARLVREFMTAETGARGRVP